ncbi:LysR family transcriptional regulator [Microbacterium thalassium]|uniref:DNA-binding transcriptional LysR family regulator n=1 Tax=Microbacterium thalassium TaxID=362649 RepID=A0A7X0FNL6_9MICO|nr:LysR family transcriptional regulator [Microbacterium thalassium]MBB6390355.1 DNA-binding transcriptional LysR family regulator [Microbacterium thalassium]GLK25464.1 LysR family transcriptional regulator [Microbacterium thalassium]
MSIPDLNQLRTFVVLYELRSLTATADFLHVTQPTVSYTLARLRERFADDLFRREGHVMVPTTRATQLFGPLHEALAQIESTVSNVADFDPRGFTGELSLGLTSIGEQTFLPPIMAALARENSSARLAVNRLDADQVEEELVRGTLDLAITVSLMDASRLWRTPVRDVEYVALSSGRHPLPPTSPEMFAGRGFVRVSSRGGHVYPLQLLLEHGLMPQVALTVEEYGTLPAVLQDTDLVTFLPRHVAEVFCGWFPVLRIAELPWPGQSTPVAVFTRRESSLSPAQRWFRRLVHGAVVEPGSEV